MKVLVIGAGAIGGYVGAMLALRGHRVDFAVRPNRAAALRSDGLRLAGPRGDWVLRDIGVLGEPDRSSGPYDLGLSCVKLYDAEASAREWATLLRDCAAVISLQNGIDGQDRVAAGCGRPVYGGLAYVAAQVEASGTVRYQSAMSSIVVGGPGASAEPALASLVRGASSDPDMPPFNVSCVEDIASAQWQKFSALATNAALTCLVRQPAGIVYRDDDLLELARQSIAETMAVGQACGAVFPDGHAEAALALLLGLPAPMFASMHHDLAAGRPLELEGLSGAVVRLGRAHGVPTPFHAMAYACLKPYLHGRPVVDS